ncbi:peptidoglycan recognition family protein [uncultured Adlercreutzia sp.]|uniref:N-acetylmuramoyl-L-alanine amidase n=2 Tax=uncultured Adlercreutzia sp. TaxID=875803 RepID=UPI0025E0DAB1|nr:peptidoglycan recognition family protein [uncultured Adlercreutzia sp.]
MRGNICCYSRMAFPVAVCLVALAVAFPLLVLSGCATDGSKDEVVVEEPLEVSDHIEVEPVYVIPEVLSEPEEEDEVSGYLSAGDDVSTPSETQTPTLTATAAELRGRLNIVEDIRPSLSHGPKTAANQKYIVLHDTEGDGSPQSVVDWWDGNGNLVASQFIIGKDGTIVQCVPMDEIAHHAGYGDTGHNEKYGIAEDGRDDMAGSSPIGSWAADYGMNAWSVGVELVHVGGSGDYPEAQLEALDSLIAYIDAYYGFESQIIDHKAWRTGNSDTSPEFAGYLANYQTTRTHDGS